MSANARILAVDAEITWDGVTQRLPRGQVIDVAPGGALEKAIGRERLVPLYRPLVTAPAPAAAPAPVAEAAQKPPEAAEAAAQDDAPARPAAARSKPRGTAQDGKSGDGETGGDDGS
jgi:hypothetical protein